MRKPLAVWSALGCLFALLGLGACQKASSRDVQVEPASAEPLSSGSSDRSPREPAPAAAGSQQPGEVHLTLTLADAETIRSALLLQLRKQDRLERRDWLVAMTEKIAPTIDDGVMRIGIWVLQLDRDEVTLVYRAPPGPAAAQTYVTKVARENGTWKVDPVVEGQVRRR